jgi:hypothetical protein
MAVAKEEQKAAPDKQKQDGKKKQEPEEELSDEDLEVGAHTNTYQSLLIQAVVHGYLVAAVCTTCTVLPCTCCLSSGSFSVCKLILQHL